MCVCVCALCFPFSNRDVNGFMGFTRGVGVLGDGRGAGVFYAWFGRRL